MKDVKLLLEKLRINREREFEREVKIFLELKKLSDGTPKGDDESTVGIEKDANGVNSRNGTNSPLDVNSPNGASNYVRKKINSLRKKTVFEQSYYRNVLNCYDQSDHYKEVIKYTPYDFQGAQETDSKKAITQSENLLIFYYAYLVRKYCERNFLMCVHNDFIRSLTYTCLEENLFLKFVSINLGVLAKCIKQVEVVSEETENENLVQLMNRCRGVMRGVYNELASLQGKDKTNEAAQLVVDGDDGESHHVCSSLKKYFPFLDEPCGKGIQEGSANDAHMKKVYEIYAFVYVFASIFYVTSLAISKAKVGRYLPIRGMPHDCADSRVQSDLQRFAMYRMFIEQYAKGDFMQLNQAMLYFLSRERLLTQKEGMSHTCGDILECLNVLRNATALQSEFFAASRVKEVGSHPTDNPHVNYIGSGPSPRVPFINHFFHVAIDFDKTIIKKDSYSAFFKILEKHYFKESVRTGKETLTEEDITFFNNFSLEEMKNKPKPTTQEKIEYIHKLGHWFSLQELDILENLKKDQEKKEQVYSKSYYHFLNEVDKVHVNYSMLLSYYDVFKDVQVDVLNSLISEHYERFELNEFFLEVFLHLLNYKMENRDSFYLDVITLNLKKQICLYTIRNNLLKVRGGTFALSPPPPPSSATAPTEEDYYQTFKKYFHVYYSKTHTYDKGQRKYTGEFEYNRLKIKHGEYQPGGGNDVGTIEKVSLSSLYDKTLIQTKVCSLLRHVNHKLSAFIGDSLIDLDAMLHADIAILIGHNELLITFCEKHNIIIKPLVCAAAKIEMLARARNATSDVTPATNGTANKNVSPIDQRGEELKDLYDEKEKVIYSTESWLEIGIFFFGHV
ncbi:hypothetical protein AK88_00500 [Plasmodium fragile]|uniref:Uncharacterized protein n=1 Tax=Plasmodium fragile TaxID=5857 RepID=A0A0D9QSJ7_PLAFR|nr:uncharacterized protein AK88_00500 [Plasmodium fragile]KJP89792.1 hypothetical protein AK88_00500 [Plasmodium fragile]